MERGPTARTFSNAVYRRCHGVQKESSGFAAWSPKPHSKVYYNAVRPPRARSKGLCARTPWSSLTFAWILYDILLDVTAGIFQCQFGPNVIDGVVAVVKY